MSTQTLLPDISELQQSLMISKKNGNRNVVPSLRELCLLTICTKIERYPPEAFAMLSPDEWDIVIERRWQATAPKKKHMTNNPLGAALSKNASSTKEGGLDGTGRMIPALNAPCLREIEAVNEHLAESAVADRLIWKDCVEYTFPIGSGDFGRPKPLRLPWPMLIKSMQNAGQTLTKTWSFISDNLDDDDQILNQESTLAKYRFETEEALHALNDAPMTIGLLNESGVGKVISKLVKQMHKRKNQAESEDSVSITESYMLFDENLSQQSSVPRMHVQHESQRSPLSQLEELLDSWKYLASAKGVNVSASPSSTTRSLEIITGQGRRTTDEQHKKDISTGHKCLSWRQLYSALEQRKEAMKSSMSAKLRKTREKLDTEQLKTKACVTLTRSSGGNSKREAILRIRALESAISAHGGGKGKMSLLRAETQVQAAFSKAGVSKVSAINTASPQPVSRFGCSIATSGPKKRAAGEMTFSGGKKMKLPEMQNVNKAKKGIQMSKKVEQKGTRGAFIKRR